MSPEHLDELVKRAEAQLPQGKTFGLMGFVDGNGVEAGLVVSVLGGAAHADVVFRHDWKLGTNEVGAKFLAAW